MESKDLLKLDEGTLQNSTIMGLNTRGRGRGHFHGRGGKGAFSGKEHRGGMGGQNLMLTPGPPGMYCPPAISPEPGYRGPVFNRPNFNRGSFAGRFQKYPRKNWNKFPQKNNETPAPEIDLSKPWVTEEVKMEEAKKQEHLNMWKTTNSDEDWNKYKAQKQVIQNLYNKMKEEYLAGHPNEVTLWQNTKNEGNYYCDTCDKSFRTDDALLLHEAEHETCGREGCQFTAHPKIIAKHVRMQHESGLYKRIGKIQAEEDIAKWIEERKKRYPSRKVIEEKKILEEEKKNRGERIVDDDSRFNKSFQKKNKSKSFEKQPFKYQRNKRQRKKKKNEFAQPHTEEEVPVTVRGGVPAFLGIRKACEPEEVVNEEEKEEEIFNISDEEWDTPNKCENTVKPIVNSSLGLLAACYDSDNEVTEKKIEKDNTRELSDGEGSAPEEVKTVRSTGPPPVEEKVEDKTVSLKRKIGKRKDEIRHDKRKKMNVDKPQTETRKLTLLEKLLKKEIRHERNVILQCVHYVVKNNFFNT